MTRHEVIIGGGGYAGLAAARALGSRALVIDQHEIGAVQRSACAMPVAVVERFNAAESINQRYNEAYFHTNRAAIRFPLRFPYCIIDHTQFCRQLWEQTGASFVKARIRNFDGSTVTTSAGDFSAPQFIDATGWAGALSSRGGVRTDRRSKLTAAIEADVPGEGDGLHIYYLPEIIPRGYGWVFPASHELRIGVGSYDRHINLRVCLSAFLHYLGHDGKPSRGGVIPWFAAEPVVGSVFSAGDSAGHCLPITAEGIRLALGFGDAAGRLLREVVEGRTSLGSASEQYRAVCFQHRRSFTVMRKSQHLIGVIPEFAIHIAAKGLAADRLRPYFLHTYFSLGAAIGRAA